MALQQVAAEETIEEYREREERGLRQQIAGTLAVRVWTAEDGVVYEKKSEPPYTLTVPKSRTCSADTVRELIGKSEPLAVAETGFRILKLWVPEDQFVGRVYYLVPIRAKIRGRRRVCVRVFENLDDAILCSLYPPRGAEPA